MLSVLLYEKLCKICEDAVVVTLRGGREGDGDRPQSYYHKVIELTHESAPMSSSSISANAKAGIDRINKGEKEVNLSSEYVEIIILLLFENNNN
jgi:hypothetical protein